MNLWGRIVLLLGVFTVLTGCDRTPPPTTEQGVATRIKIEKRIYDLQQQGFTALARGAKEFLMLSESEDGAPAVSVTETGDEVRAADFGAVAEALDAVVPPAGALGDEVERCGAALSHPSWIARDLASRALLRLERGAIRALPALLEAVKTEPKDGIRKRLAATLSKIGGPAVLALTTLLGAPEEQIRAVAALALAGMSRKELSLATEALATALKDDSARVRHLAAAALVQAGDKLEETVPILVGCLGSTDRDLRRLAYSVIGRGGAAAEAAIPSLVAALSDSDPGVRYGAALSFVSLGEVAVPALLEAGGSRHPRTRFWVAVILGHIDSTRESDIVTALGRLLDDTDTSVSESARAAWIDALRSGDDAAHDCLNEELQGVSAAAARALGFVGPRAVSAIPALLRVLDGGDASARLAATHALGRVGGNRPEVAEALRTAAVSDEDPAVRRAAAVALREGVAR